MIDIMMKPNIDTKNRIERDVDGCKVRLFFSLHPNEKVERLVLDNLMLVFDDKMQGVATVET